MTRPEIGYRETVAVLTISIVTKVFLSRPSLMEAAAGSAAWMAELVAVLFTAAFFWLYVCVLERHPGKTINQIARMAGGPWAEAILGGYLVILLLLAYASPLREFSENMIMNALPGTPPSAVMLVFTVCIAYATYLGLPAIARACTLYYSTIIGAVLLILVLTVDKWNVDFLFPLLGKGAGPIVWGGVRMAGGYADVLVLGMLTPFISQPKILRRAGLTSLRVAFLLFAVVLLVDTMVMSSVIGEEAYMALFRLARSVYLGRFLQRVEALFVLVWGISAMLRLSVGLYLLTVTLARTLHLPDYRPFILPSAVLLYTIAFIPEDLPTVYYLSSVITQTTTWVTVVLLPVAVFMLDLLGRKQGGDRHAKSNA